MIQSVKVNRSMQLSLLLQIVVTAPALVNSRILDMLRSIGAVKPLLETTYIWGHLKHCLKEIAAQMFENHPNATDSQ